MSEQLTFDLAEGRRRRDEGVARVSEAREGYLERARDYLASLGRAFTSDDLYAAGFGPPPGSHVNITGAVFLSSRFFWTGDMVQSARPEAHGRLVRVWEATR